VPAAWIATMYGAASNSKLYNNIIVPINGASFKTFQIGSLDRDELVARNIEFRSNEVVGGKFEIDATDQDHKYSVYWTLKVKVADAKGIPVTKTDLTINDKSGSLALQTQTDDKGEILIELPEYHVNGKEKRVLSPYVIAINGSKMEVELDGNKELILTVN
jgi:hypothetical protein